MKEWISALLVTFVAITVAGCSKSDQPAPISTATPQATTAANATPPPAPAIAPGAPASAADAAAVTQAVQEHLRGNQGINMSAMDMTVDSVIVDGDRAQANAMFKVKGGGATMAMVYTLERHGNGWLVLKSQPSNGEFVHPPTDKVHSGAAMPDAPPSTSGTPDVTDFLKNQPAKKSN